MLTQPEGASKFRSLGGRRKNRPCFINEHFILIDQWHKQFSQSFIKGDLEGLCLAL